jgi:hypothetical protein
MPSLIFKGKARSLPRFLVHPECRHKFVSTVVDSSIHNPEIKGSIPAAGTGREKTFFKVLQNH